MGGGREEDYRNLFIYRLNDPYQFSDWSAVHVLGNREVKEDAWIISFAIIENSGVGELLCSLPHSGY